MSIMYEIVIAGGARTKARAGGIGGKKETGRSNPPPPPPPPHMSMPILARPDSALVAATTFGRTPDDNLGGFASFCCAKWRCADFSERCASRPNCTVSARDCAGRMSVPTTGRKNYRY